MTKTFLSSVRTKYVLRGILQLYPCINNSWGTIRWGIQVICNSTDWLPVNSSLLSEVTWGIKQFHFLLLCEHKVTIIYRIIKYGRLKIHWISKNKMCIALTLFSLNECRKDLCSSIMQHCLFRISWLLFWLKCMQCNVSGANSQAFNFSR